MKGNKLKIIICTLVIISICLASFVGIYIQKSNRMENVVKDYKFSKDFTGYRQVVLEVSKINVPINRKWCCNLCTVYFKQRRKRNFEKAYIK